MLQSENLPPDWYRLPVMSPLKLSQLLPYKNAVGLGIAMQIYT